MPSLTSLANSAANGWRKLKEESLTYTPPSSEGPKPIRSPDRKLRKMSILQLTDLPRPNTKSKTSKEIQLGLPQSYIRLCETDRFFRDNHKHYYAEDSILGLIIISLALDSNSSTPTAHGHVFTKCGPMSIPPLRITADSSCYSAVYHLSEEARGSLAKQAAAMMLLKYFANTPGLVMEEARRTAEGGWGGLGGVCAFDEMHAADIAGRCDRLKGGEVSYDLKTSMEWRGYDRVFVDIVIPNDNEVEDPEGLAGFLALFKPSPPSKESVPLPALPQPEEETKETDPVARRTHILEELQSTERHFLARMQHLLQDYHTPLKTRAKSSDPLLNMYQVNTLFPRSLEIIVKAHEMFYAALEVSTEENVPNVLLEHFEKFKECYPRFLESRRGSMEMLKEQLQNPQFREFVDKQKYHGGLQIGLPELLIDPVQRIPRYSLFLADLVPVFPSKELTSALNIIKEIGLMEKRLEDKTSETWARLKRLVKDLPADLISSSRVLLDAVDCVEILPPYSSGVSGLQATVCLFSDCLVFIKRGWMEQNLSSRILSEQEDLRIQIGMKSDLTGFSQMLATYRGSISLDKVRIARSDTSLWITLLEDLDGKVQGKWTGRVERRFIPCVKQTEQVERFMIATAEARQMARGKVDLAGTIEREEGSVKIDWGIVRREQYDEIKHKVYPVLKTLMQAELVVFYVETDVHVAMPYLQSIGAPVVSLGVSCKNREFRIYEDNTLDIAPTHIGNTAFTSKQIGEALFSQIIECERILTAPYAPSNLSAYLTSNTQLLDIIHRKTLPPSFPKALASLPSSPTKSISSLLSRSPKRRNRDTLDSVRSSAFDSPSTGSQSQSSDSISRTTNSSVEDGVVIGKRSSIMFLGPETKERSVVTGIRSFVEGIRGKEWQDVEGDLNSLSLMLQKQVLELVALIDKYPTRTFAISGSSAEIAYPALRVFLKEHVVRKMGLLIPAEVLSRLHIINGNPLLDCADIDMPVFEDLKRGRFGDALNNIPAEKARIIRLLIALLVDRLEGASPEVSEKAMMAVSAMLVDAACAKDFLPVLHCMVQGPNTIFGALRYNSRSNSEFLEQQDSKFILHDSKESILSKSSTQSGLRLTPSPTKKQSRMSFTSSHNTLGTRSTMSSMSFQRTQSMVRPMSGTLSSRPISSGVTVRRPVTAVDFGETTNKPSISVRSKGAIETVEDDDWFPEHNEASVCLVVGSDDSEDDGGDEVKENTGEDSLRDMVLTANEYFSRSASANWWE